jgi:hypothetical protein
MKLGLIAAWALFSIIIYIFYVVSTVELAIVVKRVEYAQGYRTVRVDLELINRGQNFLAPSTRIEILGQSFQLGKVLGPGDVARISVVVPLQNNGTQKIRLDRSSIRIHESIDIYASLWYFIQHLPQELASSLR